MNREIKFRMWHKKSKKMFDVESINFKDRSLNMWNSGMYTLSTFSLDDVILMQYTGLHDKNGKEIWENDIVEITRECIYDKGIIVFKNGCFFIKSKENLLALYNCKLNNYKVKVIGNIYDNPELLGGE